MIDGVIKLVEAAKRFQPLVVMAIKKYKWPETLDLAVLAALEPQPQRNIMVGLPSGYATATFAHGGTGKSSIELIRAICIAAGVPFFGLKVERRKVGYLSCEDRASVLHFRVKHICAYLGIDMASLNGWLHIKDLVGYDSIIFAPDPRTGYPLTPAYDILEAWIRETGIEVLFLDGITDFFGGNENSRSDVKAFINQLLALIPADVGAVLLIGHINKLTASGGATNEGYSGSTAWHNSPRARWFLYPETRHDEDSEGRMPTGKLILELQKANYGEVGTRLEFKWDDTAHSFVGQLISDTTDLDRKHRDRQEQTGILRALQACAASTPAIIVPAATTGRRTAFHVLVQSPEFPETLRSGKVGRTRFWRHIEALRQMHAIEESSYRRTNRHLTACFVLPIEGVRQCA